MATATLSASDFELKSTLTGNYSIEEADGIVECFVAAIGNKDHVGDVILPGAFEKTLQKRKPRVVWGHDWNHPIGKVLEVYEVGPNDPRLPQKMRSAGVGGLYAKVQFNLKSSQGAEAFKQIVFYGGEQEWSIGYKTRDSEYNGQMQATLLKEVELFEMSPVLHGANSLTATISIKSAEAEDVVSDDQIVRGLAMVKTYADENPEWVEEVKTIVDIEVGDIELSEKVDAGPGNAQAIQDAIGGDLLHGRGPRRGNMEDLLDYWRPIMKKPGGFRRCLVILADHPELGPLPNLCAWLHHETTGKWPNEGNHSRRNRNAVRRVLTPGKSMDINANPATGPYAELAKALSSHFGGEVIIRKATQSSVEYDREVEGEGKTFAVDYQATDEKFFFSTPQEVAEKAETCGCGGECCKGKSLEDEEELSLASLESELTDLEEKAGRVINSTNAEKIRQALSLLREVLSSGGLEDVQVKTPTIHVKDGKEGLATALMVVGKFHGDESAYVDGLPMDISVKSEQHRVAIENVLTAMHGAWEIEGETA